MKKPFRIKPYKHSQLKFVVRDKLTGKWRRKFFHTQREAKTYVELKEIELLNQGTEGMNVPTMPSTAPRIRQMGATSDGRMVTRKTRMQASL